MCLQLELEVKISTSIHFSLQNILYSDLVSSPSSWLSTCLRFMIAALSFDFISHSCD